ncbi:MAG: translation initiation factor IF-3 [Ruminococcaceae bacterium]|nr:translation initiation factor IF-3 [Oscillospiraceae bacterium]
MRVRGVDYARDFFVRRFCFAGATYYKWRYGTIAANNTKDTLINEAIDYKEVRVIGDDGEQLGIISSDKALKMAYDKGLDLVLMSAQSNPPVCKIMDYGKYRFDREKREKEAKKKQQTVELKEIQLSPRIDTHDFETKVKHARRFLESGNKVRVVMRFRGREMSHMAIGREIIDKFAETCSDIGTVDKKPALDGRLLSMVINPMSQKASK